MIDAQQELDDEILSACHDGELPPTEAEAVRRRLAREPELAERLSAMRRVDAAVVSAFRAIDRQPVPGRVLDLLHADQDRQRKRQLETGHVLRFRKPAAARRAAGLLRRIAAFGAGIAAAARRPFSTAKRDGGRS
jgi:anti-sigma factor RsiW